jgi:hypothetical protein
VAVPVAAAVEVVAAVAAALPEWLVKHYRKEHCIL